MPGVMRLPVEERRNVKAKQASIVTWEGERMASVLRREVYVSVQFLLMVLVALIAAFFGMLPGGGGGEYAEAINLKEAWRNVDSYVKSVLLVFSVLCVLRLSLIFLVQSFKRRVG